MNVNIQQQNVQVEIIAPESNNTVINETNVSEITDSNFETVVLDMRTVDPVTGEVSQDISLNTLYKVTEEVLKNTEVVKLKATNITVDSQAIGNDSITGTNVQTVLEQQETKSINGGYF